jgi:DnaJ-class molecular chaperone
MNPFDVLNLPETATVDEIKTRWRELASQHHPDRGGDPVKFRECRLAYQEALRISTQPKMCDGCGGTGKVTVARGFNQIKLACNICNGSGDQL